MIYSLKSCTKPPAACEFFFFKSISPGKVARMTTPVRKVLRKALQSLRAPAAKEGRSE